MEYKKKVTGDLRVETFGSDEELKNGVKNLRNMLYTVSVFFVKA